VSLDWSFSAERCFRRCQMQFWFREIAAWHNGKDPLRRESFVLKQLKTLDQWHGLLVHRGIEKLVVPLLAQHAGPNWDDVIDETVRMAARQREFSRALRYRDAGVSKTKAGDDYCALLCHEAGRDLSPEEWETTVGVVERSFRNLAGLVPLWEAIEGRGKYWSELPIHLHYDGAHIIVQMDLLCFRGFGKPIIVDWKVSEAMGGSDARTQMGVYAWAMTRSPKWKVENMDDVELLEVQLLTPAVFTHRCNEEVAVELENRIFRSIDEIRSLCGDGNYKTLDRGDFALARNPNTCFFCPFRKLCAGSLAKPQKVGRVSLFENDSLLTLI
jgi:PD-(D/E)XK nuclease superfamily